MALLTVESRVLAVQRPPGLAVIELGRRSGPTDQLVLTAVVLSVASGAFLIRRRSAPPYDLDVIAPLLSQPATDFVVAIQAFELDCAFAERVAGGALQRAVEIGVGLCQRAWRHLGAQVGD